MQGLLIWAETLPWWVWLSANLVIALLVGLGIWELVIRARFMSIIRERMEHRTHIVKPVGPLTLKLHVRWLESLAKNKKIPIMDIFDFRQPWLEHFQSGKRRKDLFRLLDFYPDFALFPCLEVALRHKERGEDFQKRLGGVSGEEAFFLLKKLGASCAGREFDATAACKLLAAHLNSFRELSGDMDWAVRDFAIHILLADPDPRSHRLLWDALGDSHSHIRSAIAQTFQPDQADREKLYAILFQLYLQDPALVVRQAAKRRLVTDFADLYRINPASLGEEDALHVLELLEPSSKEDENLALAFLDESDVERRLASARFLQAAGALTRIFLNADFGDRENLQRVRDRLEKAVSVNVSGFLAALSRADNPATLWLAALFLQKVGDRTLIGPLLQKAFGLLAAGKQPSEMMELLTACLKCVKLRGNADAALVLKEELAQHKKDEIIRALIWENLPPAYESQFAPELFNFLKEGLHSPTDSFLQAWKNFSTEITLPMLLDFLKGPGDPLAKQETLEILGELKLPGILQTLLESLPQLPPTQIPLLCAKLATMNEKLFLARAGKLLESLDAPIRAAIFLGLPPSGKKLYLKNIREALNDPDPDVRLAAFTSLANYDEAKALNTNALKLLRDPVERVRLGVAADLGQIGSDATISELKNLILSEDEVDSVRSAAIRGLGASSLNSAIDTLLETAQLTLSPESNLYANYVAALARKNEKRQVQYLIEKFKDGNPLIRGLLAHGIAAMGENGEASLMELLKDDIASQKPMICQALEDSGIVDIFIRQLGHHDLAVRKEASARLIAIGTAKAFKGIVQAARDPNSEIRVLVTKALESLNTPAGAGILKELENDPDKRVRRYTAWAMERIKAKSMAS